MGKFPRLGVAAMALIVLTATRAKAADPRAQDAVDLFVDACVTDVLGLRPRVTDPSRISSSHQSQDFGFQVEGRMRSSPIYEFNFKGSRARVFTSRGGAYCAAWVSQADAADIQAAFQRAVERIAAEAAATVEPASADVQLDSGGTQRAWVLRSKKAKLILGLSTSLPNFQVRHLMTAAQKKD